MFKIRPGVPEDISTFRAFTKGLAEFENMSDQMVATPQRLHHWLFERKTAYLLMGEVDGKAVATAIYFYNFSTFQGLGGIYLEDLYVLPEYRSMGYGTAMLKHIAKIAIDEGCGRMDWVCLDWNDKAIAIYEALGAVSHPQWLLFRMDGKTLENFAVQD